MTRELPLEPAGLWWVMDANASTARLSRPLQSPRLEAIDGNKVLLQVLTPLIRARHLLANESNTRPLPNPQGQLPTPRPLVVRILKSESPKRSAGVRVM